MGVLELKDHGARAGNQMKGPKLGCIEFNKGYLIL